MWKVVILLLVCSNVFLYAQKLKPLTGLATGEEKIEPLDKAIEDEIIKLTNKEREKAGLPPLMVLEYLTDAARYHAYDMLVDNYFTHGSYDRRKDSLVFVAEGRERVSQFLGLSLVSAGENLYKSSITEKHKPSALKAMKKWMRSAAHRESILSNKAQFVGVGYYQVGKTYCFVQVFGRYK